MHGFNFRAWLNAGRWTIWELVWTEKPICSTAFYGIDCLYRFDFKAEKVCKEVKCYLDKLTTRHSVKQHSDGACNAAMLVCPSVW